MSSTSLSPAPSQSSEPLVSFPLPRPPKNLVSNTSVAETSKPRKRSLESSSEDPAPKRNREATPICDVPNDSTSGDRPPGEQNASAPVHTTTAGPSSYTADDTGRVAATSDRSVLFSEQAATKRSGHDRTPNDRLRVVQADDDRERTNTAGGNVFLPEDGEDDDDDHDDDEDEVEEEQTGEYDPDDEEYPEANGHHEESQDQNDLIEDDENGADPPAWQKGPHTIASTYLPGPSKRPSDQMSRVLEGTTTSRFLHHITVTRYPVASENGETDHSDDPPPASSYHSGNSDDFEMAHRPLLERTEIKRDIKVFVESLGQEFKERSTGIHRYKVVDRLGEGTFSSVYLAQDRRHNRYCNEYWTGELDACADRVDEISTDKLVALKKILATSSPQRIENELHILESLRGCRNVSQLITAFREEDQVIIVLPFHRSDDFRHFYRHMDPYHTRLYMRALLRALKDIHKRGVVHRDVKPANFLFDFEEGNGVLCDFGLAERYVPPRKLTCQHGPGTLTVLQGSKVKTAETPIVEQALYDARKRSKLGEGRVGFLQDDKRPTIKTNRAGTRGFRAPEVLLKCPDQTVAIDVWSAGVVLLSILTHKFPVFNSSDDIEALMEIAALFGRPAMERCALLHNRTIISNVPSLDTPPPSLTSLILKLNPHIFTPLMHHPSPADAKVHIEAIDHAIDLCTRLLRLDATKRLTAGAALRHPFLRPVKGESTEDMVDEEALSGEDGKCGYLHGYDDGKHRAFFSRTLQEMQFGEGIPPARDQLCPEHEHWQTRMQCNPLLECQKYDESEDENDKSDTFEGEEAEAGEIEVEEEEEEDWSVKGEVRRERAVLAERDMNIADPRAKAMGHRKVKA